MGQLLINLSVYYICKTTEIKDLSIKEEWLEFEEIEKLRLKCLGYLPKIRILIYSSMKSSQNK
jgi:hypothetical protein